MFSILFLLFRENCMTSGSQIRESLSSSGKKQKKLKPRKMQNERSFNLVGTQGINPLNQNLGLIQANIKNTMIQYDDRCFYKYGTSEKNEVGKLQKQLFLQPCLIFQAYFIILKTEGSFSFPLLITRCFRKQYASVFLPAHTCKRCFRVSRKELSRDVECELRNSIRPPLLWAGEEAQFHYEPNNRVTCTC